jgi:hypothetical protein
MINVCVVFLSDKAYFNKFVNTCNQLITTGKYKGDICLVIGDDLHNDKMLDCDIIKNNKITIKHFPNITFTKEFLEINNTIKTDGRNIVKKFQWHKLHLFNTFFKNWEYIFYLDCGITIYSDISPIINEAQEHTLLAHSDAYPTYERKLHTTQFDKTHPMFTALNNRYNLNIDYFQTTMMLYDTKIIKEYTFDDLYDLALEYPISQTNEQGIMALYFTNIEPLFKQIKIQNENMYFYDYFKRDSRKEYIMVKMW